MNLYSCKLEKFPKPVLALLMVFYVTHHATEYLREFGVTCVFYSRRLLDQRYRVEGLIDEHKSKIARLEKGVDDAIEDQAEEAEDSMDPLESHKESVQALQNSLTPAEVNQLSTLTNRLSK